MSEHTQQAISIPIPLGLALNDPRPMRLWLRIPLPGESRGMEVYAPDPLTTEETRKLLERVREHIGLLSRFKKEDAADDVWREHDEWRAALTVREE